MRVRGTVIAGCMLIAMTGVPVDAAASTRKAVSARTTQTAKTSAITNKHHAGIKPVRRAGTRFAAIGGGISCVPYVRMVTGMAVSGDGGRWWYSAAGQYDRGNRPAPGSVLAFRSSGGMARGHVAVVSRVVSPRHLQIDHANWGGPGIRRGSIMHDVNVVDVSDANDWTAVRVQVGYDSGSFGRTYPTYGFIYNRPAGLLRADTGLRPLTEIADGSLARR